MENKRTFTIENWIIKRYQEGFSPEEIQRALKIRGYSPNLVNEVLKFQKTKQIEKSSKKRILFLVTIACIITFFGSLVIYPKLYGSIFWTTSEPKIPSENNSFTRENLIHKIILSNGNYEVNLKGTVVRCGYYVWLENDSWAIRMINGSKSTNKLNNISHGDIVNITGLKWDAEGTPPFVNVSNVEILSKKNPITPIKVNNISKKYAHRVIKIKNQQVLNFSVADIWGSPFWIINFREYKAYIPKKYISFSPKKREEYNLIGVLYPAGKVLYTFNLTMKK